MSANFSLGASDSPTLIVMAGGLGSRYGGLKQVDAVGPDGECILDYSLKFAYKVGFRRAVVIVNPLMKGWLKSHCKGGFFDGMEVLEVIQDLQDLLLDELKERTKPFGTGHAVLCAKAFVPGPFAVVNGDDFYTKEVFELLFQHLSHSSASMGCCVGYRLENTLSPHGPVSRALCEVNEQKFLIGIREHTQIVREGGAIVDLKADRQLNPKAIVSVNAWGFQPSFWRVLEDGFQAFLRNEAQDPSKEYYLPYAVARAIEDDKSQLDVLDVEAPYHGLTYAKDKEALQLYLK